MADKKHAAWMGKDGEHGLYHADDVEAATAAGWSKLTGQRANGEDWNPEPEEDEPYLLDLQAESVKASNKALEAKAERKQKGADAERKASDKARADEPVKPDYRVEVVTPKHK